MPFGLKLKRIDQKKKKNKHLQKNVKPEEPAEEPAEEPDVRQILEKVKQLDPEEVKAKDQNFDITAALYKQPQKPNQVGADSSNSPVQPEPPPAPESTTMKPQEVPEKKASSWGRTKKSVQNRSIQNLFTAPKLPFSNPFKRDPDRMQRVQTRWRIPGLLLFKRILAVILLLINLGIGFATIPTPQGEMGLFFWINGFILLDYLWKTRYG